MAATESNKARIAMRVIEVLEFFDEQHPQATVMDIVRRFDRPQSSTSELLSKLVQMGLLHKDRHTRYYSLTPRAAMLGNAVQPGMVRDGRLTRLVDRLSAQTSLGVAVFGVVGLKAQICSWRAGVRSPRIGAEGLRSGRQDALSSSAVGWLLLSTVGQATRDGMLRRLNAEAASDGKFAVAEIAARVQQCRDQGYATGAAGFDTTAEVTAVLLPGMAEDQPLAVGFVYEPCKQIDGAALSRVLIDALARSEGEKSGGSVQPLFNAA